MNFSLLSNYWSQLNVKHLTSMLIPMLVLMVIVMMVVPLPAFMLDVFFTLNIALALIIVMISINTLRPLDFSSFPTVLLFATLLRLALNVASTRVVLVDGHTGTDAAGQVIKSFGEFVIGGNYLVGIIVFAILMIINFLVVTKGAGRVSEVSARFTLDAMPGKQMAIDADLNAGVLSQEEARERRQEVTSEADFYGSMDGASKFVKGDAIAGFLILLINIIGGLAIGMGNHDLTFSDAAQVYVLLTIGDGLVAQIPSLLLATATAIIVTRVSSSNDMSTQVVGQLGSTQALMIVAGILILLGLIPGMPTFVFLLLGAGIAGLAYWSHRHARMPDVVEELDPEQVEAEQEAKDLSWDDIPQLDLIGLEVGYALIPLVDKAQGGVLMQRIKGVRKKLSHELGFLVQSVHIRDNLDLGPNQLSVGVVAKVLQNLLAEGVAVRDIRGIVEILAEQASRSQDPDVLTAAVRPALGRMIMQQLTPVGQDLNVMTLDAGLEQHLHTVLQQSKEHGLAIEPNLAEQLLANLQDTSEKLVEQGIQPVLVVSPGVRPWLAKMVKHRVPGLVVLGYNEIPDEQGVQVVSTIEQQPLIDG